MADHDWLYGNCRRCGWNTDLQGGTNEDADPCLRSADEIVDWVGETIPELSAELVMGTEAVIYNSTNTVLLRTSDDHDLEQWLFEWLERSGRKYLHPWSDT